MEKDRSGFRMEKKRKRKGRCGVFPKSYLIQKIIVRLPVKSLGRFKMVCKSWLAIIESSSFIDLHTTFNSCSKFGSFIVPALVHYPSTNYSTSGNELISISSDDYHHEDLFGGGGGGGSNNDQLVLKLDNLGDPSFKEIIGSCNGLVCLYNRDANKISLWNPATKKQRILPRPIKIGVNWPHRLVAFGFDVKTKDYKVVLTTGFRSMFYREVSPIECLCRVQVYNLSTDSWRLLEGITCLPGDPFQYRDKGLYLNGSSFFMAHFFHTKQLPCFPENDRFIISFDFTKEIFTPMQFPDHYRGQELYLSYLGDKLALFAKFHHNGSREYEDEYEDDYDHDYVNGYDDYNIWVLNEHSSSSVNKKSWTKSHSFRIVAETPGQQNIPRGISNDGEFALLEAFDSTGLGKKMKLYHFKSKEVKWNFLSCSMVKSKAYPHKPSLVSIIGGNGGGSSSSSR